MHPKQPHSIIAEQAVIGRILSHETALVQALSCMKGVYFCREPHQIAFEAAEHLYSKGKKVTSISVFEQAKSHGLEERLGGLSYLNGLAIEESFNSDCSSECEILKDYFVLREIERLAFSLAQAVEEYSGLEALNLVQSQILELGLEIYQTEKDYSQYLELAASELEKARYQQHTGLKTGFYGYDQIIKGFKPGLHILAARPSMGKTAFCLNILKNIARQGKRVVMYSLEMSGEQLSERLLSSELDGQITIQQAKQQLSTLPFHLRVPVKFTVNDLLNQSKMLAIKHGGIDFIGIDYLQLMSGIGKDNYSRVSELSRGLKQASTELQVPILCLSQLSRAVEQRQDKRPMLSDLRESGAIEQDADTVTFLYRDEYYNKQTNRPGVAEVIVGKHRTGAVGTAELIFRAARTEFLNPLEAKYERPA